jgi:hypothetical protein
MSVAIMDTTRGEGVLASVTPLEFWKKEKIDI